MITQNKTEIGLPVTIGGKPGKVVGREDVVAYDALKRPQGLNILVRFEDGTDKWIKEPVK
jgi:hypothetical protein